MCDNQDQDSVDQLLRKAFRILRRNYGCPGPDGVAIRQVHATLPTHVACLRSQLLSNDLAFAAGREVAIRTGTKTLSERQVYVYNVRERWLQCYLRLAIQPFVSAAFTDAVYSYRHGRTRYDGLRSIVQAQPAMILLLDVRNFFGSIDRSRVQAMLLRVGVPESLALLSLKALDHAGPGLPKGNALSPIIANLYLACVDALFSSSYMRFSDDMLFGVPTLNAAIDVRRRVSEQLAQVGLTLSAAKTRLFVSPSAESMSGEYPWFHSS